MSANQLKHKARLVASLDALHGLIDAIQPAEVLALDTEFLRERTYFPELCLIQVATHSTIAAVDCLAGEALDELYATLGTPQRSWVLHSSRQDLEILLQVGVALPGRLIDTQIAAALLGMTPQIGYAQLVEDLLKVELDKSHTRTDWRRRPIAPDALNYAIDDVRYLLPLWHQLDKRLSANDRHHWFEEDCATLLETYRGGADQWSWERVKGVRGLDRISQSVARELSGWRETQAARINRPRRWLLSDEALIALAVGQPGSVAELERGYGLPSKFRARHGSPLLAAIAAGRANANQHQPLVNASLSPAERTQLKALSRAVKRAAATLGVATEVLATRQEMTAWMRGTRAGRLSGGWRAQIMAGIAC